ncbi:MAG: NAD(P)H-binding protein [Nannocystaceae bacterium]
MKILLLGASGRTGREILARALDAGSEVTALVRHEAKRPKISHERLSVCVGDPCDVQDLKRLMPGHDVVMSVLGPRRPWRSATAVYPDSGAAIVDAMQQSGVERLLVTSSGLLFPGGGLLLRALKWLVRRMVADARRMEERIRASGLDWTIARTSFLTNADATSHRVADDALPAGRGAVARAAVATFLLVEAAQPSHRRQVVGLCG